MSLSFFRVCTVACLSLILGGFAGAQSAPQQVVQVPGGPGSPPYPVVVPWPLPDGAKISNVTTYVQGSTRYLEVQMMAPVATSGGILIKAAYSHERVIAACLSGATVPNYGVASGQAKVIDLSAGQAVGSVTVSVNYDTVTLSCDNSLVSAGDLLVVASDYADAYYLSVLGPAAVEMFPGSVFDYAAAPLMQEVPLLIQVNRTWPTKWDPNWRVPTPGAVPKPGDVTGDGRNDWDCNGDTWIVPLGDVIVDKWVSDNGAPGPSDDDSLITVIGHDLNHNGRLEANEVTAIIGECREVPGLNRVYIEEIDGKFYIHHINFDDNNRNGVHDSNENLWHYIYDTSTGILKIYDKDGNLVYMGPPDGSTNQIPGGSPWDWWYDG